MVGEYFDKKGNSMVLTLGPWQSVTALMKNKKNHIIMHDSGTGKPADDAISSKSNILVQNEVTDKIVKFNRLGLSRFDGEKLNFFEGRIWTRKSIQLKSSLDQTEPELDQNSSSQTDQKKSLFSITKSNYRLRSNTTGNTLSIQLS